ncbi:MAG TPA: acyl-CoA dehydrogenase family protein [Micropepsaceae bacterium]|nr:acyl-CoA dehydrogenase family protein [Micropepsaceae bacterium]
MNIELTADQKALRDAVAKICAKFPDAYWLACDRDHRFPEEFVAAIAAGGWLGIAMPREHGGAGLGVTEAAIMMHTIARSGAGMAGASSVHINLFGPMPLVVAGNAAQQAAFLPPLISGKHRVCFGVTEPDAGLDTTRITTRAVKQGGHYVVTGRKIWTSTAQSATHILLLARTTPIEECARPADGLSLFYADLDRSKVEVREIAKMGRHAVDSNMLFIDGLIVSADRLIGREGDGFAMLLHGLNPERILVAAEAIGIGEDALSRAALYARERKVFGRPIGQNQAIQHPLARCHAELEAAKLMMFRGAALFDAGQPCGVEANMAKYLAAEAGYHACETAVMTHGGMGYAQEFHVERLLREVLITRIAPVSREMILSHIAEKALGLPKSY